MSSSAPPPTSASETGDAASPATAAPPRNDWPFLIALAVVAGLAELAAAIVGVSALPIYIPNALHLADYVGFTMMAFYLSEAVFNSPMGALADRIGRRRMMVLGALAPVVTCAITMALRAPHGTSAWAKWPLILTLILLRSIDGIAGAAFWPAVFASIGDRIDKARQSSAMGVLNISYMIGLAFGPKVGGLLNDTLGGRLSMHDPVRYVPSFGAAAIFFGLASVVAFIVAPRRSEEHHNLDDASAEVAAASSHASVFSLTTVRASLRRFPALMGLIFLTFFGIGLISMNVKLFAMSRFHISENEFGNLLLIPALLVAALSIPLSRLGDHWGKTRSIRLGMGICAMALWLILAFQREHVVVVIGCLLGVGFVLAFPAYMALLSSLTEPHERGGVIGSIRMAQGVGAMIGVACGPLLYQHVSQESPFLTAAGMLTISFVLSLFFVKESAHAKTQE